MPGRWWPEDLVNESDALGFTSSTTGLLDAFKEQASEVGKSIADTGRMAVQAAQRAVEPAMPTLPPLQAFTRHWDDQQQDTSGAVPGQSRGSPGAVPGQSTDDSDPFNLPNLRAFTRIWDEPEKPKDSEPSRTATTPAAAGIADARPAAPSGTPQAMPTGQPTGTASAPASAPSGEIDNSSREAFIRSAFPHALQAADGDPVLARQLIATAISENGKVGTGRSLGEMGFNVGGIQGVEGTAGSFTANDAGRPRQFAAYNNLGEGFRAVRDLVSGGRYADAAATYRQTGDIDRYWREVNQAGYSETPDWQDRIGVIRRSQVEPLTSQIAANPASSQVTPSPAEQAPAAQRQGVTTAERPTQFASGLSYAEAIAACGLAGVAWFISKTGRPPQTVAEVRDASTATKDWDPGRGMHGAESTAHLLRSQGVAARVEPGVDWTKVRADVAAGNPVMFDTDAGSNGHYYTVQEARQRSDGQWEYDLGTSATDLRASKGRRWFSADEVEGLGFGRPFRTIYTDNPQTPAPSVVAGRSPTAGASSPAESLPAPRASGGDLAAAGSGDSLRADLNNGVGDTMQRQALGQPMDEADQGSGGPERDPRRFTPIPNIEPLGPALKGVTVEPAYMRPGTRNRAMPGDVNEWTEPAAAGEGLYPGGWPRNSAVGYEGDLNEETPAQIAARERERQNQADYEGLPRNPGAGYEGRAMPGTASVDEYPFTGNIPQEPQVNTPGAGNQRLSYRQPLQDDEQPYNPDEGPRESGYTVDGVQPSGAVNDQGTSAAPYAGAPASASTYGDAGDEPQVPSASPTLGPPLSEAGPAQQPSAIDAVQNARAGMADQQDLAPRENPLTAATAPARDVYGRAIEDVNQQEDAAQRRNEEVITSELGRALIAPVEQIRRGVRLATAIIQATPEATTAELDAALSQFGYGKDTYGVDLPIVGRTGIADAVLTLAPNRTVQAAMTAGMPIAHAPGMGAEYGRGVAGVIERGTGAAVNAGVEAARGLGTRVAEGLGAASDAIEAGGHRVLDAFEAGRQVAREANAADTGARTLGTAGIVPPEEPVRIPGAGYATDLRPGAEAAIRQDVERNAVDEPMRRAEVARRAQEVLGLDPEAVRGWQDAALARPETDQQVRAESLRHARDIDAEAADRAIERLRAAQQRVRDAGAQNLGADEKFDAADALLEAAEAARAMQRSGAADTAESRAAARQLGQRRFGFSARQAFESAARARQVGQDAAFAAQEVRQAAATGQVTEAGVRRLQIVRDKLLDAERHGLVGDGAGGRLAEQEQRSAVAMGTLGINPRPGAGLGTRIASEVGSSLAGGVMGAAAGTALPAATPEERRRNALIGAGAGLVGGPVVRRLLPRGRGEALATFGPAPTPEIPNRAVAIGADPSRRYEFRYRVANLDDLVPSNLPNGAPNPAFPRELQPRARERVASQLQIDQIARGLEPDVLLTDVGRLDAGPMIVGPDRIVESGNGRTLGLRRAAEQYPEQYQRYVDTLRSNLGDYGLTERDMAGVDRPVLVRERVTPVDRPAFAQEANNAGLLRMSSVEQAAQDAGNLSDATVTGLHVGENDTIASALRKTENRDLVRQWVGTLAENERAGVLDASGSLSAQGYERLTNALLMRTYGQGAGERLARTFIESADPTVRNVQTALMQSLPDVARSEALIRGGQRDAGLSIAGDVAAATEMLARLRRDGIKVSEYLDQAAMFERELTPLQEDVLRFLDANQRRPSTIREALKDYAARVENTADPNQGEMFGGQVAAPSREDLWRGAAGSEREAIRTPIEARAATERAPTDGAGLARAESESVAPVPIDIPPAPTRPSRAPVTPQRPGAVAADFAPGGGPEGRLSVEGAPTDPVAPQPTPRLGAVPEGAAPAGGPEGSLRSAVAPDRSVPAGPAIGAPETAGPEGVLRSAVVSDRSAPAGQAIGAPAGGPEGTLSRRYAADRSVSAGPVPEDIAATGGAESTLTLASGRTIKDVAAQIDEVLANPRAPGAAERLQALHQDLQEISTQGFKRSSEIKARLQRNGLLRAGLASKDQNVDALVTALARTDPNKPEEMQAVLRIISQPRLIDRLLEYQYVNMLSSPITQAINTTANTMQIAGRLFLQNPLEFVYSGGRSGGVGAAFEGAAKGFKEGLGEAGQIIRTGTSTADVERGLALGDYSHINREALTEQFGPLGAALHMISTRPLAAMDALMGHVAYASAAEQFAQRKADQLLRAGSQTVKGMDRQAARQHILANIWDHPEIVEQAGKIEDYTLLRSKDTTGKAWGPVESKLRQLASVRNPAEDAGFGGQVIAFAANQALPFFNVPLNFAKQGVERTAGVPVNTVRALAAYGRGDVERGAELMSKATIGAAAITTAGVLAAGDNLTGDGPSDPGRRKVWELTHRRNSFRFPNTETWLSWEGTPWAIPFGMVAGVKEGWSEAGERAARKGEPDTFETVGSAAIKAGQGAFSGFASQSFVKSLGQQYQLLTGDQTGLGSVAASAAGTVSRFVLASGMVNLLARVTDTMERDPGKPQTVSDIPGNVGERLATRVPGLRQGVDTRLDIYGEDTPNEQTGAAGLLPYYRGSGVRAGDPITRAVEASGVGAPAVADDVTIPGLKGAKIPLTSDHERRVFQQAYGRAYRQNLEAARAEQGDLPPISFERLRALARESGVSAVLAEIGPDEIERRLSRRVPVGAP